MSAILPFRRFGTVSIDSRLRRKGQNPPKPRRRQAQRDLAGAELRSDKKRPAGNTGRISKGLCEVWARFYPLKSVLPLSIDGINAHYIDYSITFSRNLVKYFAAFLFRAFSFFHLVFCRISRYNTFK